MWGSTAPQTPDPLLQFLQRVVPWDAGQGFVNIHAFGGDIATPFRGGGRAYADLFAEYGGITSFLSFLNRTRAEAFFCISLQTSYDPTRSKPTHKRALRKRENALQLRAFVLDLDVKPGAYPSQRAALAAALPFCDDLGLEPGPIVSTGRGLHVYVTLDAPVDPTVWQPLADRLIAAAQAKGLKIDVGVTRDAARILRMPTTYNRKDPNNPLECRVLSLGKDMTLADLTRVLDPYASAARAAPTTGGLGKTILDPKLFPFTGKRIPLQERERVSAELARAMVATNFDLLRTACAVVASSDDRMGDGDSEPLWFELAKLCHYVEDGRDHFHDLSSGDARYDPEQADHKYDTGRPQGWPACATVAASSAAAAAICDRCQFRSMNKSPIHHAIAGRSFSPGASATMPPVTAYVNGHASSGANSGGYGGVPIWLDPAKYSYTTDGYILPVGGGPRLFNTPILDVTMEYETQQTTHKPVLWFTTLRGTDDTDDTNHFPVTTSGAASVAEFAKEAATYGLFCNDKAMAHRFVMTDLLTRIRDNRLARTQRRQGWIVDNKGEIAGFGYGGQVYDSNGPRSLSVTAPEPVYAPRGTLADWQSAAGVFIGKGCIEMEIVIATAFAAPLILFTVVDGLIVFVRSSQSGEGKTASLEVGASVWMSKQGMLTHGTVNATLARMTKLNNLPLFFDEFIKDSDERASREFAKQVLNISAGKQPARLGRNLKEIPQVPSRTLFVGSSNVSLTELAKTNDTNAHAARVLELELTDAIKKLNITLSQAAVYKATLEKNYGNAGACYAEFLGRHHKVVGEMVNQTVASLQQTLQATDGERFWIASAATIIVGATIAKKLGILAFDTAAIRSYLIGHIANQRSSMQDRGTNADDPDVQLHRVVDFINDRIRGRIITNHMPGRGRGKTEVLNKHLLGYGNEYPLRLAKVDAKLWISEPKLAAWCKIPARNYSYEHMKGVLVKNKYCVRHRNGRSIGGGCDIEYRTGEEIVLEFDLTDPKVGHIIAADEIAGEPDV